jgi:Initiator Replication protein
VVDEKPSSLELKKHVNTIHCSNALTLVQRKLFNALLFNAYHDLLKNVCFEIPVKKLCQLIGYNSHDYDGLKRALLGLMSITIEWNIIDTDAEISVNKWAASTVLSAAKLEKGICNYEYSSALKQLLFKPEVFGCIDIETQSKFKSSYGLALYENCIRYIKIPYTRWFSLEPVQSLLSNNAIKASTTICKLVFIFLFLFSIASLFLILKVSNIPDKRNVFNNGSISGI